MTMKKIYSFVIASIALLAFAPNIAAQTTIAEVCKDKQTNAAPVFPNDNGSYTSNSDVGYSKHISKPQQDGTYWIKLEAFATGTATVVQNSIPSDAVLVLDLSSSMNNSYNGTTRLEALKTACIEFLESLYDNAVEAAAAGPYDGNRVAIVTYSGGPTPVNSTSYIENVTNGFVNITSGVTKAEDGTYSGSLITSVRNFSLEGHSGTRPDLALQMVVNSIAPNRRTGANFSVLVFTDGYPVQSYNNPGQIYMGCSDDEGLYYYGNGAERFTCVFANDAIYYANQLKGMGATVFSVGLIASVTAGNTPAYQNYRRVLYQMELISSNYQSVTTTLGNGARWNIGGNGYSGDITISGLTPGAQNTDGKEYFQLVNEDTDLSAIFKQFSDISGGTPVQLDGGSTTVDIVSSSFILPPGATKDDIKLFTARCTNSNPYQFETEWLAGTSPNGANGYYNYNANGTLSDVKVDRDLDVEITGNKIEVTGFDYSTNWCGPIKNGNTVVGTRGYKIIIMIPIRMNPNAVGGPNVQTNATGSGIYAEGATEPLITFTSPTVSLPVNVFIEKKGLKGRESAKFKIERAVMPASGKVADVESWEYVSTVFVTKTDNTDPIVKVRGMPATAMVGGVQKDYIYKITEENWSWSYNIDSDPQYTVTDKVDNPFTFTNEKREDENIDVKVRHAESKVTNLFKGTGERKYDDSKKNKDREEYGGLPTSN